jgi:hypothetical protein
MPPGVQQQQQMQQQYGMGPSPGVHYGDPSMNGHPAMNGNLSRPTSAASNNHFLGPPPPGPDQRVSPGPPPSGGMQSSSSQHPSPNSIGGDPNGGRSFAGAPNPPSASSTPNPAPHQPLPPPPTSNGSGDSNGIPVGPPGSANPNDGSFQLGASGGDFSNSDLVDFESFLNGDMFTEEGS